MSLRWPLVALDVGAGAHRARTGTVGRAGPRGGLVEGEGDGGNQSRCGRCGWRLQ